MGSENNDRGVQLQTEYRLRFDAIQAYRNQVWEVLTRDYFQQFIPPDSVILELGCGWGEFINNIRAGQKHAMDLNADTASKLNPGITLHAQDCSLPWTIGEGALDVVFTSNFLEHLADKNQLATVLEQAYRCLQPGGRMLCLGPNIKYTGGEYWDFWDHHIPLTDASLGEILELTGFRVTRRIPRFLPFSMATGFRPPLIFLKTYLRLPFAWPIFGKQFFIVAEKPA
jgi:ubiquinone/menaquinone biosynthesis C-methylase UbiE